MSRHLLIASAILLAPSAMAQEQDHSDHSTHAPATQAQPQAEDHSGHEGHTPPAATMDHTGHGEAGAQHHDMRSALGG